MTRLFLRSTICFVLFSVVILSQNAFAATFTVTSKNDSGAGSLREAIISANADPSATAASPHIIDLSALNDTIKLLTALPAINRPMTIDGPAEATVVLTRALSTTQLRFLYVSTTQTIVLNNLTFYNGNDYGGAIYLNCSNTSLQINNCIFKNNSGAITSAFSNNITIVNSVFANNTSSYSGAAVNLSSGSLIVNKCTFTDNTSSASGGAIYSQGNLTISGSAFRNNKGSDAGAVYSYGSLTMTGTDFNKNSGANSGGGLLFSGPCSIDNCNFTENKSTVSGNGGAISTGGINNVGNYSIKNSNFSDNSIYQGDGAGLYLMAGSNTGTIDNCQIFNNTKLNTAGAGNGGGICTHGGIITIKNTAIYNNINNSGGGIYLAQSKSTIENCSIFNNKLSGTFGSGGGVYTMSGSLILKNSTINSNSAVSSGGGIYMSITNPVAITNVTVSGNSLTSPSGNGAGIYNSSGTSVTIQNSTIAMNKMPQSFGNVGGMGIYSSGNTLYLNNTIVIGNSRGNNVPDDLQGNINSIYGHNVYGTIANATILGSNHSYIANVNATEVIDTVLANNGGTAKTHALVNCSFAIDGGTSSGAPGTDQIGNVRKDSVDVGALESSSGIGKPYITKHPENINVCVAGVATFKMEAPNATGYKWQVNKGTGLFIDIADGGIYSGANTATLTVSSITADMNRFQFRCYVNGSCNSLITSNPGTLTINTSPKVTMDNPERWACAGGTAVFSVTGTGGGLKYIWQINTGTTFSDIVNNANYYADGNSLSVNNSGLNMTGYKYRAIATNACTKKDTSASSVLHVHTTPEIISQPQNQSTCLGGTVSYSVNASANVLFYQWQVSTTGPSGVFAKITEGGIYKNTNSATLTVEGVTASMTGYSYRCELKNGCATGSFISSALYTTPASLTVNGTFGITQQPEDVFACEKKPAMFSIATIGSGLSYQWQADLGSGFEDISNVGVVSGATTNILTISDPSGFDGIRFRCNVTGAICSQNLYSVKVVLHVSSGGTISKQPQSVAVCGGVSTKFITEAAGTGFRFKWQVNDGTGFKDLSDGSNYSGTSSDTLKIVVVSAGMNNYQYRSIITDGCGTNLTSDAGILTVSSAPSFTSAPVNATICPSSDTFFKVSSVNQNLVYQWQGNSGSGFENLSDIGYYSGSSTATLKLKGVTSDMNGNIYRCTITNLCGTSVNSASGTLTVNPLPEITTNPVDKAVCSGGNTSFTAAANGTGLTYKWQSDKGSGFNDIVNGTIYSGASTSTLTLTSAPASLNNIQYRCVIGNACGTSATSSAKLSISGGADISVQPFSKGICAGANAEFNVVATDPGQTITYNWQVNKGLGFADIKNDAVYSNSTTSDLAISNATTGMNNYSFRCRITSGSCATPTFTSNVILKVSVPSEKPTITDLGGRLSSSSDRGNQWYYNSDLIQGATSQLLEIEKEGSYYVVVFNDGCPSPASDEFIFYITGNKAVLEKTVTIFPNPSQDNLTLKGLEENYVISIIDVAGNTLYTSVVGIDESIPVKQLPSGFYIIEIATSGGILRKEFIKQ